MPNRATRRSSEVSEFDKLGFKVTLHTSRGEEPYEIGLANMSAQDEFDFHKATELTFFEALDSMSTYVIAAFVWLERRRCGESRLTYQEVCKEVKLRDLESIKPLYEEEDEDEEDEPPEPVSGKSPEPSGGPSGVTSLRSPASTG